MTSSSVIFFFDRILKATAYLALEGGAQTAGVAEEAKAKEATTDTGDDITYSYKKLERIAEERCKDPNYDAKMNIPFRLKNGEKPELEDKFINDAQKTGFRENKKYKNESYIKLKLTLFRRLKEQLLQKDALLYTGVARNLGLFGQESRAPK